MTILTFAGLIAGAVTYNSGRIARSERARERAGLRILGFTRGEVAGMLLGEQAILTAATVSSLALRRRANRLNLVAVLKARE